jgi:hypothetical protein
MAVDFYDRFTVVMGSKIGVSQGDREFANDIVMGKESRRSRQR